MKKGRCSIRIQKHLRAGRRNQTLGHCHELRQLLPTWRLMGSQLWLSLWVCFFSSLFRSAFSVPLRTWEKMSALQSTHLHVPLVQPPPETSCILESQFCIRSPTGPPRLRFPLISYSQGRRATWPKYVCEALIWWMRRLFSRRGAEQTPWKASSQFLHNLTSSHDFWVSFVFIHSLWSSQTFCLIKWCFSVFSSGFSIPSLNKERRVLSLRICQMISCRTDSWEQV